MHTRPSNGHIVCKDHNNRFCRECRVDYTFDLHINLVETPLGVHAFAKAGRCGGQRLQLTCLPKFVNRGHPIFSMARGPFNTNIAMEPKGILARGLQRCETGSGLEAALMVGPGFQ